MMPSNSNDDKEEKDTPLKSLQALDKDNCFCVDCGSSNPEWASINLGVLTCIECSGFHRSMGVHISKVRSLNLDIWEPELVELMGSIGNANANKIFEFVVMSPWQKPNSKSTREVREKWIRAKYEKKLFVNPVIPKDAPSQLHLAAKKNDFLGVLQLLAQGVDVDSPMKTDRNKTVLHTAVAEGSFLCVELLVLNRANIAATDAHGWTAFHYAAENGDTACAAFLLKNCDNRDISELEDIDGITAMDIAVHNHNAEVVNLFLDYQTRD